MAADGNYVRQLAVVLHSLTRAVESPCRVHVVQDGITAADRDRVRASVSDDVQLEWIDPAATVRDRLPVGRSRPSIYFRLFLDEMLPGDVERVLYLDADVVVRRPLTELWATELADAAVAAVRDAYMPWVVRDRSLAWRSLDVAPESAFFNSGVMLMSLERWRESQVGLRTVELLPRFRTDQDALNVVLADRWLALHPRWNVQSYHLTGDTNLAYAAEGYERLDAALADPAIVHYTGGSFNRPWQEPCSNPYRDEWFLHLDQTAWRGWRPKANPAVRRARGRAKRALGVLRHGGTGAEP